MALPNRIVVARAACCAHRHSILAMAWKYRAAAWLQSRALVPGARVLPPSPLPCARSALGSAAPACRWPLAWYARRAGRWERRGSENTRNGFFNADGDASANFTRDQQVNAYVGSGVKLTAGAFYIQTDTTFDSLEISAQAGSGGIDATGNTYSTAISTGGATIDIGAGATINAGVITLLNEVQIPYSRIASAYSGDGVYGQPEPTSRFNLGFDANNNQV
jgi:hypothetical protein